MNFEFFWKLRPKLLRLPYSTKIEGIKLMKAHSFKYSFYFFAFYLENRFFTFVLRLALVSKKIKDLKIFKRFINKFFLSFFSVCMFLQVFGGGKHRQFYFLSLGTKGTLHPLTISPVCLFACTLYTPSKIMNQFHRS